MGTLWKSYTLQIELGDDGGGTPEEPTVPNLTVPASEPVIQPTIRWIGCDLSTGDIISELPDLSCDRFSRGLGTYTSAGTELPIPLSGPAAIGPRAIQATEPRRTMLVAIVNDLPVWAGIVLRRVAGSGSSMQLSCVSPEGYLARRKVRDHTFNQTDDARIMSIIAQDAESIDGIGGGLGLVHEIRDSGSKSDETYLKSDRVSVLQRMQELSRRQGGPEWTVDLVWSDDDQTRVDKVLRVAPRIGGDADAVFDSQGGSVEYTLEEDYSDGRGANWVEAYGVGEGDDQPGSAPVYDADDLARGIPIYERHWQPSSSIETQTVLDRHARAEYERLSEGAKVWKITARWDQYPRYGVDWKLGDTVAWSLVGHRHPTGVDGSGRVIGWELQPRTGMMTPILLDPTSESAI